MSQAELADVLGLGISTLRRIEASADLKPMVALAVECLLRRRAASFQRALTPEERAERKFREQQRLRELREAAGLTARGLPPKPDARAIAAERVETRVLTSELRRAIARNKRRDADREMVRTAHGCFKAAWAQGRDAFAAELYRIESSRALFSGDDGTARYYLREYVDATRKRFNLGMDPPYLPDDAPLTTLGPEPEQ